MTSSLRLLPIVVGLALGCAGTQSTAGVRVAFEEADVSRAQRAPDLLSRAERARDRAEEAAADGDNEAAADYATEARLWLRAAMVEADRLELEDARLTDEREEEAVAQRLAHTRARRRAHESEVGRERAAAVAREQMERAFEAAEARETRRRQPDAMSPAAAARAFIDRARLLTAAARALGAPEDRVSELLHELDEAPAAGGALLRQALALHRRALSLLGHARAGSPVTPAVVASLVEAAQERGLEVSVAPDGAFVSPGRRDETKVADLLRAFPHGPVKLEGRGARRLGAALGREGIDQDRLEVAEGSAALAIQLPAYGTTAGLPQ